MRKNEKGRKDGNGVGYKIKGKMKTDCGKETSVRLFQGLLLTVRAGVC